MQKGQITFIQNTNKESFIFSEFEQRPLSTIAQCPYSQGIIPWVGGGGGFKQQLRLISNSAAASAKNCKDSNAVLQGVVGLVIPTGGVSAQEGR